MRDYSKQLRRKTAGRDMILAQHSLEKHLIKIYEKLDPTRMKGLPQDYFICDVKIGAKSVQKIDESTKLCIDVD